MLLSCTHCLQAKEDFAKLISEIKIQYGLIMKNILLSILAVMALSTTNHANMWDDIEDDIREVWDDFKVDREESQRDVDILEDNLDKTYEKAKDDTKEAYRDLEDDIKN